MAIETIPFRHGATVKPAAAGPSKTSALNEFSLFVSTDRLVWMFAAFVVLSITIVVRLVVIELHDGPDYRAVAAEPIVRKQSVPAMRGRILAGDGTVLACDQPVVALAVNYRWLEEPANLRWLRRTARLRLSTTERRDSNRVAEEERTILDERHDLTHHLAELCGLTDAQWQSRTERIQRRVQSMSVSVNARHQAQADAVRRPDEHDSADTNLGLPARIGRSIVDALFALDHPPVDSPVVIAEEVSEHVVYEGLPVEAVAEIEANPDRYPGVKLVKAYRRAYPQGDLAAHMLGYLGRVNAEELAVEPSPFGRGQDEGLSADGWHPHPSPLPKGEGDYDPDDWLGRSGLERQYESLLCAQRGVILDELDVRGVVHSSTTMREPADGDDLVITLDTALQRSAQSILDQALARRLPSGDEKLDAAAGGVVIAIDVRNGAILAAAAAPRFDPNAFVQASSPAVARWLTDPARPLFDRTVQMALPPGSVFKIVSAAAILASGVDPRAGGMPGLFAPARCVALRHLSPLRHRTRTDYADRRCAQLQCLFLSTRRATWRHANFGLGRAIWIGSENGYRFARRSCRKIAGCESRG